MTAPFLLPGDEGEADPAIARLQSGDGALLGNRRAMADLHLRARREAAAGGHLWTPLLDALADSGHWAVEGGRVDSFLLPLATWVSSRERSPDDFRSLLRYRSVEARSIVARFADALPPDVLRDLATHPVTARALAENLSLSPDRMADVAAQSMPYLQRAGRHHFTHWLEAMDSVLLRLSSSSRRTEVRDSLVTALLSDSVLPEGTPETNYRRGLVFHHLIRLPDLSADELRSLARHFHGQDIDRWGGALARHPGANAEVWLDLLRRRHAPDVEQVVLHRPAALESAEIRRALLQSTDGRVVSALRAHAADEVEGRVIDERLYELAVLHGPPLQDEYARIGTLLDAVTRPHEPHRAPEHPGHHVP